MNQDDQTIYFPYPGDDIVQAIGKAKSVASNSGQPVRLRFKGVELDVIESRPTGAIVAEYIKLVTAPVAAPHSPNLEGGDIVLEGSRWSLLSEATAAALDLSRFLGRPVTLSRNGIDLIVSSESDDVQSLGAAFCRKQADTQIWPANASQQNLEDFESDLKKIEAKWKGKHNSLVEICQYVREGVMAGDADRLYTFLVLYHETLMQCWRDKTKTVPR